MISQVSSGPLIIAHRGASAEAPENTLAAITRAIDLEVHHVEIDVRLSKEGIPVVLHDPSASRMTGIVTAPVRQLTLPQIKKIAIGTEKIPTLLEVLELDWKNTGLMIEIKKSVRNPKLLVDAVYETLSRVKKPLPTITIGSFCIEIVKELQKMTDRLQSPCVIMGIIEKQEMINLFLEQDVKRLALWYRLATWDRVRSLKEKNIEIWTFTVDDIETAKFLISLGVNGIISNNPKLMLESSNFYLR